MEKIKVLHYIKTDEAEYYVYNIKQKENSNVSVAIIRNSRFMNKRILEKEIEDESIGLCGGDSWDSFVHHCINALRAHIKWNKECLIIDTRTDNL